MAKKETDIRTRVLYGFVGTSDPIRGFHDGPMLHILRHYRPEVVVLNFTQEMREWEEKDHRYATLQTLLAENWGYTPTFVERDIMQTDVSDMDSLYATMREGLNDLLEKYPTAEILINSTSGTPQMQMVLMLLSQEFCYHTKVIQVKNHQKQSGTAERTNVPGYNMAEEWALNENEDIATLENRCCEPQLLTLQRENQWKQVNALLRKGNFEGALQMAKGMPLHIMQMLRHLSYRNLLQDKEAKECLRGLETPHKSYPLADKAGLSPQKEDYQKTVEYVLRIKNLWQGERYTEFLLALEPLTVHLQEALLDRCLQETFSVGKADITTNLGRSCLSVERLQTSVPTLYAHYQKCVEARGQQVEDREWNYYLCEQLLTYFTNLPRQATTYFASYGKVKSLRNQMAHQLQAVKKEEINPNILKEIEEAVRAIYPECCDPSIFNVYEKSIRYVEEQYRLWCEPSMDDAKF